MKTTLELVREHGTVRTYAHNYTLGVDNSVYEFDKEEMEAFRKACVEDYVAEQNPVAEMRWRDGEPLVKFNGFVEAGTKLYALKGETE